MRIAGRSGKVATERLRLFSGIVEAIGAVVDIAELPVRAGAATRATRLNLEMGQLLDGLPLGASVAVNGVCLTLADARGTVGGFDVVPETWRRTNLRHLRRGDGAHLERSLRVGDRIDGHFVQGHVDGVGTVDEIQRAGDEYKLWLAVPAELMPYMVRKGSIALDGVSLTLVDVTPPRVSVVLIPTTLERTTLGRRRPDDAINIETDILARLIVQRLETLQAGEASAGGARAGGVTWAQLREGGYLR